MHMFGGFGRGYGMYGGYGLFGGIGQLLLLLVVGVVIYMLIKRSRGSHSMNMNSNSFSQQNSSDDAIELAKLRYARGEINLEEYQNIINTINK